MRQGPTAVACKSTCKTKYFFEAVGLTRSSLLHVGASVFATGDSFTYVNEIAAHPDSSGWVPPRRNS